MGGSFQGDKDLVIFFYRVQRGNRVAVTDDLIYAVMYPYFMVSEDNVVGAICVYDGDAGLDGAFSVYRLGLIFGRWRGRSVSDDADDDDGKERNEDQQDGVLFGHGLVINGYLRFFSE
jgi:hypothetical protein